MDVARLEAAAREAMHYEGSPCKRCKGTLRYTAQGHCVACMRARHTPAGDPVAAKNRKERAREARKLLKIEKQKAKGD